MSSELNFVRQQGFKDLAFGACAYQYPALMWQPRAIAVLLALGVVLQVPWYFLALAIVLWWNALVPRLNPFDALYNHLVAARKRRARLGPAPSPRRFAQGLAGTLMIAIAVSLKVGARVPALAIEGILAAALIALVFGRFCVGSYLFLLLIGQGAFARRTLPWARAD